MAEVKDLINLITSQQEREDVKELNKQKMALSLIQLDMQKEWQLNTILLQDARSASRDAKSALDTTMESYSKTAGTLPDLSKNAKDVLNTSYQGEISDINSMIDFYDDKAVALTKENKRIENQLISASVSAKKEYAKRFPLYVGLSVEDELIDPNELEMLIADLKREANENKIKEISAKVTVMEGGSRAERTNNPGAMIFADWQKDYGAIKSEDNAFWQYKDSSGVTKEVFSEDDIPEGVKSKKYYTAEFPDKSSGEKALNQLVSDIWTKSGGDVGRFVESYSGLEPGTEAFEGYAEALRAIDLLDSSDLVAGAITTQYYSTPIEQRMALATTARLNKAEEEFNRSNTSFQMLQGLQAAHANLFTIFGKAKDPKRREVEVALGQGSVEAFHSYIKDRPKLEKFIIETLKSEDSVAARKFKSFFSQAMKGMDRTINLRYPSQNVSISDDLASMINKSDSVDDAVINLMTLSSGLSTQQRSDLYEDFEEVMIEKYGSTVKAEIDTIFKSFEVEPLDTLKSLDAIRNYSQIPSYQLPKE